MAVLNIFYSSDASPTCVLSDCISKIRVSPWMTAMKIRVLSNDRPQAVVSHRVNICDRADRLTVWTKAMVKHSTAYLNDIRTSHMGVAWK